MKTNFLFASFGVIFLSAQCFALPCVVKIDSPVSEDAKSELEKNYHVSLLTRDSPVNAPFDYEVRSNFKEKRFLVFWEKERETVTILDASKNILYSEKSAKLRRYYYQPQNTQEQSHPIQQPSFEEIYGKSLKFISEKAFCNHS